MNRDYERRRDLLLLHADSPPPWTPAALQTLLDKYGGFFLDGDYAAGLTYTAQPTIPGAGWSGASWAGAGLGPYTHTPGATTGLANAVLQVGARYLITFAAVVTAGTVTCKAGTTAGTARAASGTYTEELVCAGNTSQIFTPSADFDGSVVVTSIACISITTVVPRLASAGFAAQTATQAVNIYKPWASTKINNRQPIRFGNWINVARLDLSPVVPASANQTWIFAVNKLTDTSAYGNLMSDVAATSVYLNMETGTAGQAGVYTNGGNRCVVSAGIGLHSLAYRRTPALVGLCIDGNAEVTYGTPNAVQTSKTIGSESQALIADLLGVLYLDGAADAAEIASVKAGFASYYGTP